MDYPRIITALAIIVAIAVVGAPAAWSHEPARAAAAASTIDFNRDIRSILSDKCFRCHGPDSSSREADLRLDREVNAKADREGHPAVVPFKPDASELIRRITSSNPDERMPPADSGKSLKPEETERLRRWITEGATWSLPWAYLAPRQVEAPPVQTKDWPVNWIDHFTLSRLEAERLEPSSQADKRTLIRRLSIDLIGLPPSPDEVNQFVNDDRPEAYEELVDRLLASPHFGERLAAYWLDLVRYADTVGCHGDQDHSISPYRDYVIAAFNANKPFDQLTREQLAGDLLPNATVEQKVATGYNRLLQTNHECGVQVKEWLAIYAADRVRNVSSVWLGGTLGCAQCHDHKYDPFTQKDFYSLAAFFADVDETSHLLRTEPRPLDALPTSRAPEIELRSDGDTLQLAERKLRLRPNETDSEQEAAECKGEIEDVRRATRRTMVTVSVAPRMVRILPRGDWRDESGPIVAPAVPGFLGELDTGNRRPSRLDLANWLTDPKAGAGGLTARVIVNRFWYLLFGEGISRVLDDFGAQGEAPIHPELLDRLAIEFMDSGWNVKHVIKLIVLSRTYRQASELRPDLQERDPLNRLLARQAQFRFPAETVRDSALAISGLLVRTVGGPSVKPYQPTGYYRHLNMPSREYEHHTDDRQWRRGVYMHWQRQYLHPMLKSFDAPSREECTAQRPRSNTALAALVLLNDPTFTEAARALAERALKHGGDSTDERIHYLYRCAASRSADRTEQRYLTRLLIESERYYTDASADADSLLAVGLKPVPDDLNRSELAAWTIVARAILNLHEVFTRN
jgi:hypothetical protein